MIPVIYIAGPFRCASRYVEGHQDSWGIQQNVMRAMEVALEIWRLGGAAITPHANSMFFQNAAPDDVWLAGDLAILAKCDAIFLLPNWETSAGARAERDLAEQLKIAVFDDLHTLDNWLSLMYR